MSETRDIFDVMYTNRSHREFTGDPVPDELIEKVLDAAVRAPSGSNSQKWRFVVITDPEVRAKIGNEYREILLLSAASGPTNRAIARAQSPP